MNDFKYLEENIRALEDAVSAYPGARLLAATKTVPAEVINAAAGMGLTLIGENRVQELLEKYDALDKSALEIHFIGSLQRNKVKYIADKVSMIHSLDSLPLAREIDRQCAKHGRIMDVLIEVNIAREESKGGVDPDGVGGLYAQIKDLEHVRVRGLMTMAPAGAGEDGWRRYFAEARLLFDGFCARCIPHEDAPVLSMGMSDSYAVALECGSTMVRVGSKIFGKRA